MSFYSSGDVRTMYIDPKSFIDGRRAVFELDRLHSAYLPDIHLLDVGGFGAQVGYNELIGALGLIEDITLYDGKTILSQSRKFGLYRAWQSQNMKNSHSQSVASRKNLNQMGYKRDPVTGLLSYREPTDDISAEVARDASKGASLNLKEVLPLLNNIAILPTDMFNNLRIEINFNNNIADGMYASDNAAITGQLIPTLAVDVMDDKKMVSEIVKQSNISKGLQWLEWEHDQVVFPAAAGETAGNNNVDQGVVQEVTFKLDAFKGKFVERLLEVKEFPNAADHVDANVVRGFGKFGSYAFQDETIQYRKNGVNVLPDSGATGNMERLYHVVNAFGDSLAFPGSNQTDFDCGARGSIGPAAASGTEKTGNLSYNGIALMDRIQDLQITQSRTGLEDTGVRNSRASTKAMNLHFYAEVKKAMVPQKNGSYLITYL